jgi:dihydroorotate dehydrogenase (NAD+) catalytic subunit
MRAGRSARVRRLGVGGWASGRVALALVAAGASGVQVGTAIFHDPAAPVRVRDELRRLVVDAGFERFLDVVGIAHERI